MTTTATASVLLQRKPRSRRKLAFLSAALLLILLSSCFYFVFSTNSDLKYYLTATTTAAAVTASGSERSGRDSRLAIQNNSTTIIAAVNNEGNEESSRNSSIRLYSAKQVMPQLHSNETISNHSAVAAAAAVADNHTQYILHYQNNQYNTSNNNYNNTAAAVNYTEEEVTFIPTINMPLKSGDIYSGMWYQSISLMMTTNYTAVTNLEGVTFQSFHASKRYHNEQGTINQLRQQKYHPLMTQDWLDFSVEHLSKYVRHFSKGRRAGVTLDEYNVGRVKQRVVQLLQKYVENSLMCVKRRMEMEDLVDNDNDHGSNNNNRMETAVATAAKAALQHTIAIIPIRMGGIRTVDGILSILQTTATIVSLWKYHFPRIVIAGVTQDEREAYHEMMDMLHEHMELIIPTSCEIVYVHMEGDESEWTNVPKMAMVEFQRAIRESRLSSWKNDTTVMTTTTATTAQRRNNSSDEDIGSSNIVQSWLGANPNRWRHIYFTEPDLILHTRLMALPSLIRQLDKGRILTAHRLQPLPHIQQFIDLVDGNTTTTTTTTQQVDQFDAVTVAMNSKLGTYFNENALPNHGPFHTDTIQLLNPHNTFCCDQGNYFPANTNNPNEPIRPRMQHGCPGTYELCGFRNKRWGHDYSNWTHVERAHQFLINYTLIAFDVGYGTGLPLVHAHQRVCRVQREACS
jgi:hypothetical protein